MKTAIRALLISLMISIIAGCASMPSLPSGAKKIIITEKPVAKNCVWIKQVSFYNPGHPALTPYQHALLERDEFNKLRIQAYQVGGNTVFLSEYRIVKRSKQAKKPGQKPGESHTLIGEVYRCPIK